MKTLLASLYQINRELDETKFFNVNTSDAEKFVEKLSQESLENKNKRGFSFRSENTEVSSLVRELYIERESPDIKQLFQDNCKKIAERLLNSEKKSVSRHPNMKAPKRGSLIITLNIVDEEISIIIAKIETANFLDDLNLRLQTGLPYEKAALKTATIKFYDLEDSKFETNMLVTDTGTSISKYWSEDFLESIEITSDKKNTLSAFTEIEKVISKQLKGEAPSDFTELRNNLVGYFKNQSSFNFDNMMSQVFGEYRMENENISTDHVKGRVEALLEKGKFDTHFTLVPNEIKARFRKTYKVTADIEIRTLGHVEDLKHVIKAGTNDKGEQVLEIKIENEEIYKSFLFENDDIEE